MHGCGDGHLLIHSASGLLGIIGLLGVEGEPRPFVLPFLPCPTVPHGEVAAYLLADVGLCRGVDKDERLAVPAEPVLVVGRFLVPFIIELRHHACGVGVAAEGQLGRWKPQRGASVYLVDDHLHLCIVGESVGHIEEVEVYARIGEHLHVLGHDEAVAPAIVSQCRFAAPVELSLGTPCGRVRVLLQQSGDVLHLSAVLSVPHIIEHAHTARGIFLCMAYAHVG